MGGREKAVPGLMKYVIYLTPSALADIAMANGYYNSKSDGLGKRMVNEVDIVLNNIASNPHIYSVRYRDIRAAKVATFPYLIFYKIKEMNKSVEVLRVFNTHQQPFW